jgi:hypothetical protein
MCTPFTCPLVSLLLNRVHHEFLPALFSQTSAITLRVMTGPDYGSWYHPSVVRGCPSQLKAVTRTAIKKDIIALARDEAAMKEKLSSVDYYDFSPCKAVDATAQLSMKMKVESLLADGSYAEKQGVTSFNLAGKNLPYDTDNLQAAFNVPPSFSYTKSDNSRSFKHESLKMNVPEIFDEADLVDGQLHQGLINKSLPNDSTGKLNKLGFAWQLNAIPPQNTCVSKPQGSDSAWMTQYNDLVEYKR